MDFLFLRKEWEAVVIKALKPAKIMHVVFVIEPVTLLPQSLQWNVNI